ncbi:DUF4345 domain-containing protein [Aureimonas flava]|uniref:DUF4345 domain-containing protein n=1 Tax=Aureimonas flava TaxID=2320271 RepID=A0A3A1WL41_9HYPH|nr:DUF4345 family protein [Aureimonas flava]RIY01032.1 DUF4345 domain-containing protein [Aureimonas flava]
MPITLPATTADALPFAAACFSILYGLFALFAPGVFLRMAKLQPIGERRVGLSEIRGTLAGFPLGTGLVTMFFFDQPFMQMTLGAGWLFVAFGRLVSILSDDASSFGNWLWLLVNLVLAGACLAPVFGLVAA